MANPIVLLNSVICQGGVDLSSRANEARIAAEGKVVDVTTFGDNGWRNFKPGSKNASARVAGLVDFGGGAVDPILFDSIAVTGPTPVSFAASRTAGDIAYMLEAIQGGYNPSMAFDEAIEFSADYVTRKNSSVPFARGYVIAAAPLIDDTTAVTTATVEIAEAARLKMFVHVFGDGATGTVTPRLDWDRVGGGGSGTSTGTAAAPGNDLGHIIDIAWPDPGNDINVGVTLTPSSATFGYIVTAAACAA